jgi:hypothetical protein
MDAHSVALAVNEAADALEAGRDPVEVADAVFHAGYRYGLWQSRHDRDTEYYGVEGGGEVLPTYLAEEFTSVAESTDLNTVTVAELMAAAYEAGRDSWNWEMAAKSREARAAYRKSASQPPASQAQEASSKATSHDGGGTVCQHAKPEAVGDGWQDSSMAAIKENLASLNDIVGELVAKESGSLEFAQQVLTTLRSHSFDLGVEFRGESGPPSCVGSCASPKAVNGRHIWMADDKCGNPWCYSRQHDAAGASQEPAPWRGGWDGHLYGDQG